jgi:hypothetical protein
MKRIFIFFISFLFLQACTTKSGDQTVNTASVSSETVIRNQGKPSDKDILLMVMQNCDVLLTVDSTCLGVGTNINDSTIGQYLSGFWQYQTDSSANNSITIKVAEGDDKIIKEKHWKAIFMINGQTENENWSWGVSFYIMDKNWVVVKDSFKCLGAG